MRGLRQTLKLTKGLRVRKTQENNSPFLLQAKGFRLGEAGLNQLVNAHPVSDDSISWPFPQYFMLMNKALLCFDGQVYELGATGAKELLINTLSGTRWDIADFGDFILLGNGTTLWEILPDGTTNERSYDTTPKMQTFTEFKGQVVGANITGDWYDCNSSYAVWSNIGSDTFIPDRKNEAGYRHLGIGPIVKAHPLGDQAMIFYGYEGIALLSPLQSNPGFAYKKLDTIPIDNGSAVAGDSLHVFVSTDGTLFRTDGQKVERVGYSEWLSTLSYEDIVISYDSFLGDYYISDGDHTFVYNQNGLTEVSGGITTLSRQEDTLVGWSNFDLSTAVVELLPADLNLVGMKSLEFVEVGVLTDGAVEVFSKVYYNLGEEATIEMASPLNDSGYAYLRQTGNLLQIGVRITSAEKINLDYITIGIKLSDNRIQNQLQTISEGTWNVS